MAGGTDRLWKNEPAGMDGRMDGGAKGRMCGRTGGWSDRDVEPYSAVAPATAEATQILILHPSASSF